MHEPEVQVDREGSHPLAKIASYSSYVDDPGFAHYFAGISRALFKKEVQFSVLMWINVLACHGCLILERGRHRLGI